MNSAKVIFKDSQHNYTTSVSEQTTEQSAKDYFIGTWFNVASYPREEFKECIGIEYTPKQITL
jgi:hypothetical protein